MAFDLRKLQNKCTPAPAAPSSSVELETQLVASVARVVSAEFVSAIGGPPVPAVLINRPASQRPTSVLTVTTIEGPAAAHAMLELVAEDEDGIDAVEDRAHAAALTEIVATPPKARRGRPRKNPAPAPAVASFEAPAESAAPPTGVATAIEPADPKAPAGAPAPTASGCAPSVGDLAVAVSALIDAVRSLETTGKTGLYLQDAEEAMQRFEGAS